MNSTRGVDDQFTGPVTVEDDDTVDSQGSHSSMGSGFQRDGPLTFGDLVDLTGSSKCRVLMTGSRGRRVCGNDVGECTRKNHATLTQDATRRAEAGWYVRCPGSGGAKDGDARECMLTTQEALALQQQEIQEQAAALADLGDPDASMCESTAQGREVAELVKELQALGQPDGSLGASFQVEFQEEAALLDEFVKESKTPGASNVTSGAGTTDGTTSKAGANKSKLSRSGSLKVGASNPGNEPDPVPDTWYGLENTTTGDRIATKNEERARFLSTVGWVVRRLFDNLPAAEAWVALANPRDPVATPSPQAPPLLVDGQRAHPNLARLPPLVHQAPRLRAPLPNLSSDWSTPNMGTERLPTVEPMQTCLLRAVSLSRSSFTSWRRPVSGSPRLVDQASAP